MYKGEDKPIGGLVRAYHRLKEDDFLKKEELCFPREFSNARILLSFPVIFIVVFIGLIIFTYYDSGSVSGWLWGGLVFFVVLVVAQANSIKKMVVGENHISLIESKDKIFRINLDEASKVKIRITFYPEDIRRGFRTSSLLFLDFPDKKVKLATVTNNTYDLLELVSMLKILLGSKFSVEKEELEPHFNDYRLLDNNFKEMKGKGMVEIIKKKK